MNKYRVSVPTEIDDILNHIRNRDNPEYALWRTRDFYCKRSAEIYAFELGLRTGKTARIKYIDRSFIDNENISLVDKLKRMIGDR